MPTRIDRAKWRGVLNWTLVVGWTALIYATIPIARRIQTWVTERASREAFMWFVFAAIAIGLVAAVLALRRQAAPISLRQWILLFALGIIFAGGTWHLRANAEEAMHFVQYGALSLLAFRAYAHRYGDRGALFCAGLLGALLGAFDEVIQWAVPRRYFDLRDIAINVISVWLIQLGLAAGLSARIRLIPAGVRSARMAWRLATGLLLLMLGIVSNTPHVWQPLYSYFPTLFVFNEAMVEYGHLHRDPQIGSFKSRLTLDQIRSSDRARADEAGEILRRMGSNKEEDYYAFLARYSMITDPFLYEMRVRLFRRDRYWNDSRTNHVDAARRVDLITVAFGEHRILESYYSHTLKAARRQWSATQRARAEEAARKEPYHSPVSRELITSFSKRQAQITLGVALLVSLLIGPYDVKRRARRAELRGEAEP